ncbi:DNA mismatch repair protein msh6 [Marasmius crinis-equi]|uniref:DNA mismatch repair protein n=1 Tax=Marasmius crinis-equi TaxID=585013 RepID=A0ABR3FJH6_9AGAR
MASKSKSSENLKQKSLMSFFGKPNESSSAKTARKAPAEAAKDASKIQKPQQTANLRTPAQKQKSSFSAPATSSSPSTATSKVISSPYCLDVSMLNLGQDTPPTSDAIDVDMVSSPDVGSSNLRVKTGTGKRKIILEDSDSDIHASARSTTSRGSSLPADSSPVPRSGRASSRASTDDDDFIANSDEESDAKSFKSSSRASSRHSVITSDEEEEEEPTRKKATAKSKKAPKLDTVAQGGSSMSFLTAAERREQDKKNEKKAGDNPYSFLLDVKDKDGRRPGDPKYDPRTLYVPPKAWKDFTPFEKQFWEIKQNHYDTVLFFQKGKFFELYEDDARIGHREFDLKLTERVKMCMVGVPEMSFDFWAAKFLGKGYKVGRVDQAETALGAEMRVASDKKSGKAKATEKDKIVRRELHKVYTNGTLVDGEMITDDEAGHCISIREIDSEDGSSNVFGVCVLDCSTSQFDLSVFEDDICRTKLETLMRQVRPKELLFTKGNLTVSTTRLLKLVLPAACGWTGLREVEGLDYEATLQELKNRYPSDEDAMEDDGAVLPCSVPQPIRDIADSKCAVEALGSMIWYLQQLNIDKDILTMKNFNIYDPMKRGEGLVLDGQTLAHIEVLMNNEGTEEGSLLKLLSRCVTPFGKRLFRLWLCMPLRQASDINARLDAVEDLMNHPTFESAFTGIAKGLPDLERVVSRVHAKNCKVKDFLNVLSAFEKLSKGLGSLVDASESFNSKTILGLLRSAPELSPNIKNIQAMYERPSSDKDINELTPREGKDEQYDLVMDEIHELESSLGKELKRLEKSLGCSLNWWHSAVGSKEIYLVETSASQKQIPKDWTKNSGTKAKTRWVVPSLQKDIRALKEARERRSAAIKTFKYRLFAEFDADRAVWLRAIRVFAELDCLFSLAKSSIAIGEPSCRPVFLEGESACVEFKNLRHPNIASLKDFIPNTVNLGGKFGRIALLTGPNMAGKSTVMRMTATGIIMAQLGMFVPADEARQVELNGPMTHYRVNYSSCRLCPVDSILTRMGAYDNMFSNSSTFKVELDECCKILRDATAKSLVILDELGRGTSTYDGMAIAGAVLHQLATFTLPLAFFATHYGSLTDDFAYHPNIRNMHMSTSVDDERREIVFLYKLVEGIATSSFGTHVASLAGVPLDVVDRAQVISEQFAAQFREKQKAKQQRASSKLALVAQADFAHVVNLALGKIHLPADRIQQRHVLRMLKNVIGVHSSVGR